MPFPPVALVPGRVVDMATIVVADDHEIVRESLADTLSRRGGHEVVGQAANGEELLALLASTRADVVLMDLDMPRLNGIGVLEQLKTMGRTVNVLVLSADDSGRSVRAAIKAGARGYLPKRGAIKELDAALATVLGGNTYISPEVGTELIDGTRELNDPFDVLSSRERQIVQGLIDGKKNRELAAALGISVRTIDTHRTNVLKKLGVKSNADLVRLAIREGFSTHQGGSR